jgi:hypothetical protein
MADPSLPSLFPVQAQDPDLPSNDPVGVGSSDTLLKDVAQGKRFKIKSGQKTSLSTDNTIYFMSVNGDEGFFFQKVKQDGTLVNPPGTANIPNFTFFGTHPYAKLKVIEVSDEPQGMPGGKRKRKTKKGRKSKKSKKTKRRY